MLGTTYSLPAIGEGTHGCFLHLPLSIASNQVKEPPCNLIVA